MFIIRPIFFIVTLSLGFVLSQNLDGISKIREGIFELATSFVEKEQTPITTGIAELAEAPSNISRFLAPEYWKYGIIIVGVFAGIFTASWSGALLLGFIGGILFSPEIASYPILSEYALLISNSLKDFIRQLVN